MNPKNFWYVIAESQQLKKDQVLSRTLFGEWIALFRNEAGDAVALQDKCLHRVARLSKGRVSQGQLTCPYHGWTYAGTGQVVKIPSEKTPGRERCAATYSVIEKDDYIYLQLESPEATDLQPLLQPFPMPHYKDKGYANIRLQNLFDNSVTNCAENFLDIPHTSFVHPTIFRNASGQKMGAKIERLSGHVRVTYLDEKSDFGIFSWFLNPGRQVIRHTDEFFMPNVTTVNYWFGNKHFIITSQSVPVTDKQTLVYTDLTYNYGIWNWIARPIIRWQGQAIIDQDVEILKNQSETIEKYGAVFQNSPSDLIHTYIESIQNELHHGRDPRQLPHREGSIEFWN